MNNISGIPVANDTSTNGSNSSSSFTNSSNTQLNANSFITLLTAQLKAQDPTSPMDPAQMMGELVSMNSLQQLILIQQDLSGLSSTSTPGAGSGSSARPQAQGTVAGPSPANHDAILQNRIFSA
jgi:flagellar hook assembly protein FlgD